MYILRVWLPRRARLSCLFLGRVVGARGAVILSLSCMRSATRVRWFIVTEVCFYGIPCVVETATPWFFDRYWGLHMDALGAIMLALVCTVSFGVHVYAVWYLGQDPHLASFLSILGRFTLAMRILVTAPNVLQFFLGWEGVGVCSFALISFWGARAEAARGRMKRVMYNRVGDLFLLLRLASLWFEKGTLDFRALGRLSAGGGQSGWTMAFLVRRRRAKSAQVPLHGWLADAMEGPTPVSSLLHAATMVVAGVFRLMRLGSFRGGERLDVVGEFGRLSCAIAAILGRRRGDLKAVIAFSTCSQLGYMVLGVGASVPGNALAHLVLHGRFKAALFLGAGCVLHRIQDEQDLRCMGGMGASLPATRTLMWVGTRRLVGLPYVSGFCSKDSLLEFVAAEGDEIWLEFMGLVCLGGTAFYRSKSLAVRFSGRNAVKRSAARSIRDAPRLAQTVIRILCTVRIVGGVWYGELLTAVGSSSGWWGDLWEDTTNVDQAMFAEHQASWTGAAARLLIFRWIAVTASLGMRRGTNWWIPVWVWFEASGRWAAAYRSMARAASLRLLGDRAARRTVVRLAVGRGWDVCVKRLDQGAVEWAVPYGATQTVQGRVRQVGQMKFQRLPEAMILFGIGFSRCFALSVRWMR